jgi:hypothetical protein
MWMDLVARSNAVWCDAVCSSHGLIGTFHERFWACPVRTPPLYPDAVTLSADASADEVLDAVDTSAGCSVKDSYSSLDLGPAGFHPLFDATWIVLEPHAATRSTPTRSRASSWQALREPPAPFAASLSRKAGIVFAAGSEGSAVFSVGDDVIDVSNVSAATDDAEAVWSRCIAFAQEHLPRLPLVGYERDDRLAAALACGFDAVGQLRVWVDDSVQ